MIERIVIDNYKSIKHADVKLQKLNLLIGPNNSGKSNFLKCISGINTVGIVNNGDPSTNFTYNQNKENLPFKIELEIPELKIIFPRPDNDNRGVDVLIKQFDFLKKGFSSEIYKINPDKLKALYVVGKSPSTLSKDGENISLLLQNYLNKHRFIFNAITKQLYELTDYFNDIVVDIVDAEGKELSKDSFSKNVYSKFGLIANDGKTFWADELSEGVLYLLSLLCIINQPNHPSLILIEEPETGIHPRRLKEIIDLIRKLTEEKDVQVIMTTHSPMVVDLFEDEPESIFVFEMKNGFTEIKNLQTDIIDPVNNELAEKGIEPNKNYGTTLGQKWVFGFLGGVPV
jgi:AAA15 family ATPase/GTPase